MPKMGNRFNIREATIEDNLIVRYSREPDKFLLTEAELTKISYYKTKKTCMFEALYRICSAVGLGMHISYFLFLTTRAVANIVTGVVGTILLSISIFVFWPIYKRYEAVDKKVQTDFLDFVTSKDFQQKRKKSLGYAANASLNQA